MRSHNLDGVILITSNRSQVVALPGTLRSFLSIINGDRANTSTVTLSSLDTKTRQNLKH